MIARIETVMIIAEAEFIAKSGHKITYEFGYNGRHHYLLRNGSDYAGLWFKNARLEDYDGVEVLSKNAARVIRSAGYVVPRDCVI